MVVIGVCSRMLNSGWNAEAMSEGRAGACTTVVEVEAHTARYGHGVLIY